MIPININKTGFLRHHLDDMKKIRQTFQSVLDLYLHRTLSADVLAPKVVFYQVTLSFNDSL